MIKVTGFRGGGKGTPNVLGIATKQLQVRCLEVLPQCLGSHKAQI